MAYQQPPQGYPQQMQPQMQMQQPPMPPSPYGAPMGMAPAEPMTPAKATMLLVFAAFGLAALGILIRAICGFLDPSAGIMKLRNAGTMMFAFGSLSLSLSLAWAAYKVFEKAAVQVMAILGSIILLIWSFFFFGL